MQLYETFEVKFKDKNSAEQKSLLKNAIIDLYQNFDDYKIVERSKGKKDQTSDFMDKFHITKFDIFNLLDESLPTLNLAKYADILIDRDRKDNHLYILYFPNAKVGNWDYSKSREKLLYIKWNPINKNIISFHTMRDIQDTNRDSLTENKTMNIQDVIDFVYTHTDEDFVLTDLEVLRDLKKDLKDGTKPMYELADVKGVKDDIIQTMELNSEQKKVLNDFVKKVEGLYKGEGKIEEKLSFAQLKSEVVPQSKANQNLNYFYKQRNKLNGQGNRNIKFVASQFDPNEGSMTFMYRTDATFNDEDKKELVNENPNDGTLRQNISDEYDLQLKVCDFWEILDELIEPTDDNFTKEDMKAILELSEEIRIGCSCPSQYWTGSDFYLTQIDAQLKDCTISPKWWNKPHLRPNVLVCKHLLSLLNHISFFLPNMAMSCKKELKNYGLI